MNKPPFFPVLQAYLRQHPHEAEQDDGWHLDPDGAVWLHPFCLRRALAWGRAHRRVSWEVAAQVETLLQRLTDHAVSHPAPGQPGNQWFLGPFVPFF